MHLLHSLYDLFMHLDRHLNDFAAAHQVGVYGLLVLIVFMETGFVVTPFLPGDSLLFAVGALAAQPTSPISLPLVIVMLCAAANSGDVINYTLGRRIGPKVFSRESSWLLNKKHLLEAQKFYDKHGRKTIIMARFVPIVRTFAPFVAGIGKMPFARFIGFSVSGGILWVVLLTLAGYFLGTRPFIKDHFELVILAIIFISILPMIIHYINGRRAKRNEASAPANPPAVDQVESEKA